MNGDFTSVLGDDGGNGGNTPSGFVVWLRDAVLRLGFWPGVAVVTVGSVVASNVVTFLIATLIGEADGYASNNLPMVTTVSALIAPPLAALMLSLVFELDRSRKEMEAISRVDALTGVINRRHFYAVCRTEFSRAVRHHLPASVLMIDIDHFKRINDTHGHDAGDAVLVAFANRCTSQLRKEDVFARTGGEEFAVLLPMTDLEDAAVVAEKLRRSIEQFDVALPTHSVRATISVGVAQLGSGDTVETIIKRADQRLYAAKSAGRNVIVAH